MLLAAADSRFRRCDTPTNATRNMMDTAAAKTYGSAPVHIQVPAPVAKLSCNRLPGARLTAGGW